MKRVLSITLCAALLLITALPAFAAQEITAEEAMAAALKFVPSDSKHIQTEDDGSCFEVTLFSEQLWERYEIDIAKADGAILSFDSDVDGYRGSSSVGLSEATVKKTVTDEIKDANDVSAFVKWDDGTAVYHVTFTAPTCYGEYEIHSMSGRVMERDITIGTKESLSTDGTYLTEERAAAIAKDTLGGRVTDLDFDNEDHRYVYKVEIYKDYTDYNIILDAKTGEILSTQSEPNEKYNELKPPSPPTSIPEDDRYYSSRSIRRIVENKAPDGGRLISIELTTEDGRAVYEGEVRSSQWECEFTVDAASGVILEWDQELIPNDDD